MSRQDTYQLDPTEETMRQYLRTQGYGGDWRDSDFLDAAAYLSGSALIEAYVRARMEADLKGRR